MQQVDRRTPMPKCDFNKVAFRKPFPKNNSGGLLLNTGIKFEFFIKSYNKEMHFEELKSEQLEKALLSLK